MWKVRYENGLVALYMPDGNLACEFVSSDDALAYIHALEERLDICCDLDWSLA